MEPIYSTAVQTAFAGIDLENTTVLADRMLRDETTEEIENLLPLQYFEDNTAT